MMKISIEVSGVRETPEGLKRLACLGAGKSVYAGFDEAAFVFDLGKGRKLWLFGDVFYHIRTSGIKMLDSASGNYLKALFSGSRLEDVIPVLEGQYIGLICDEKKGSATLFADRYARLDSFYALGGGDFYFANDLDFIFKRVKPDYDQLMLAQMFSVYGWYAPKGHTIYKNVKQPRVGEILTMTASGVSSRTIKFKPLKIEDYTDKHLDAYYNILRQSVVARANRRGKTWISSSSGWDSSMLLALAVNELGAKNVGMVSGSMKYSKETDVINRFEINKIKKIGKFYGVKPEIVEFNFKDKSAAAYWEKVLPFYRSKHTYSAATYNFTKLSGKLGSVGGPGQTILNGETSDSFHNFGFSQFATFFHTNKQFTEYSDKMNCYLYGPSFFKKVLGGTHMKDKVYQIFRKMTGADFADGLKGRDELVEAYLMPMFYGGPRVPLAKTCVNPALAAAGQEGVYKFPFRSYMPDVLNSVTPDNLYSWIIYLYHSFHAQGSTVNTQKNAMELNGHRWRQPYNDIRLLDFLSKMPESWGRGLELNNTKYPLKWVAKNRVKFPYELLDEGPHSYLYDVIEGFSLGAEVTYRSGVTDFFKDKIQGRPYRDILTDEYFDLAYLDRLTEGFLNGKEAKGADFNNLTSLLTLASTGWY